MFNSQQQFYPTPPDLVRKVHRAADIGRGKTILDPTAGNGALLENISNPSYDFRKYLNKTFAIEIDPELRYILQGKGHKVIGSDFLAYSEPIKFDRVLMNPPFNQGAKMILKGWNVVKDGGRLVALISSATLSNPNTKEKQLLNSIIEEFGQVEELGAAFLDAERSTKVEVSMIALAKPEVKESFSFDASQFSHNELDSEDFKANPLAHTGVIQNLVAQYKAAEIILVARDKTQKELDFYLEGIAREVYTPGRDSRDPNPLKQEANLQNQVHNLKSRFWNTVFEKTELGTKSTSSFREKFTEFAANQVAMEFTEQNIKEMLAMFFLNQEQIMLDCIVEVFEKATSYHKKNKIHTEGWKTNKSWKLSKRIIQPNGVQFCNIMGRIELTWQKQRFLDDLDKCLCWLSGQKFEEVQSAFTATRLFLKGEGLSDYQQTFESTFFRIRVYKKGTMHLDFKDLYLLDDLNIAAAKGKKWIGGDS